MLNCWPLEIRTVQLLPLGFLRPEVSAFALLSAMESIPRADRFRRFFPSQSEGRRSENGLCRMERLSRSECVRDRFRNASMADESPLPGPENEKSRCRTFPGRRVPGKVVRTESAEAYLTRMRFRPSRMGRMMFSTLSSCMTMSLNVLMPCDWRSLAGVSWATLPYHRMLSANR